jgi:beta-glucanase (GH16 family)
VLAFLSTRAFRAAALGITAIILAAIPAAAQDKPGWKMIWSDEFSDPAVNASKWNFEVGPANVNSELEYYSNSSKNAFIQDGSLVIRAIKENVGGRNYTSSKLFTRMKGDWLYGRIEVRAKLPKGKGMWPAIWMMPTDNAYGGWPSSGEMDIMELLGHEPAKVYATVHWNSGGHQQQGGSKTLSGSTFADDYHTFAYEWDAGQQRWFIDDVQYFSTTRGQPFDKRFYLILNLAVGGSWPGNPDGNTAFPNDMAVDFVRVYQKSGSAAFVPDVKPRAFELASSTFQGEAFLTNGPIRSEVVLRDVSGKVLERGILEGGERRGFGKTAPGGVYLLQIRSEGHEHTLKVFKAG